MLTGDRTASPDARFHDLAPGLSHPLEIVTAAQIKTNQRMQIAIAGMKHIRQSQFVARADAISLRQHLRQTRARYHGILNHYVGTQTADGAERAFARGPEFFSLVRIRRAPN